MLSQESCSPDSGAWPWWVNTSHGVSCSLLEGSSSMLSNIHCPSDGRIAACTLLFGFLFVFVLKLLFSHGQPWGGSALGSVGYTPVHHSSALSDDKYDSSFVMSTCTL